MFNKRRFMFFQDPGHGWLRVKYDDLQMLGLVNDISTYSYQRGRWVYLEEDSDAPKFLKTWRRLYNYEPVITSMHSEKPSRIRGYNQYEPARIRLACMDCDRDDHDGILRVPAEWGDVCKVQSYEDACKVYDNPDDAPPNYSVLDWFTHLGQCPECRRADELNLLRLQGEKP